MPRSTNWFNPMPGQVHGVISLAMLANFPRCLPRRRRGGPAAHGRQMIQDALAAVDAIGPRDRFEVVLVMQIPTLRLLRWGMVLGLGRSACSVVDLLAEAMERWWFR